MDWDMIRWLLGMAAVGGAFYVLMQYRMNQAEKAIEQAKTVSSLEISRAKVDADAVISRYRDEARKELDLCWTAIHSNERNHNKHVEEAYKERLNISERFTDVLLAQNTFAGEMKSIASGVSRLEGSLKELTEEMKKS